MILEIKYILKYIIKKKLMTLIMIYIFLSSILKSFTKIDICIPCFWKLIFGIRCYGCGLTTAFIDIINLNFKSAFESNCLIFIIIPFSITYIIFDFYKFKLRN